MESESKKIKIKTLIVQLWSLTLKIQCNYLIILSLFFFLKNSYEKNDIS